MKSIILTIAILICTFCMLEAVDPWGAPVVLTSSMTVMSNVLLDGLPTEQGDVLAAFVNVNGLEELRGKSAIQINNGISGCIIQIFTESNSETISFKLWDESSQSIRPGGMPIISQMNAIIGSWPNNLYIIYTGDIVNVVATPTFSPAAGIHPNPLSVSISCATPGASIRYTTDSTPPVSTSDQYTAPFLIYDSHVIKAKAFLEGYIDSPISVVSYVLQMSVIQPVVEPPGGNFLEPVLVSLTCADPEVVIRYTMDNSIPTESSLWYTGPLLIDVSTTLNIRAYRPGWFPSILVTEVYNIASANPHEGAVTPVTGIQNIYPNPFSHDVNIAIGIAEKRQDFRLQIYNIKGELVHRHSGNAMGNTMLSWNGKDDAGNKLSAGIYLITFQVGKHSETRKVILK